MNLKPLALLFTIALASCATTPDMPTNLGNGLYMLSGSEHTVFGSYGAMVKELVGQANAFCEKSGKTAVIADTSGTEKSANNLASASIQFGCE